MGVANYFNPEVTHVTEGSDLFGRAFEHFLLNEIRAHLSYAGRDDGLAYWRTSSGFEVDLIVGDMLLAIEFKAKKEVRSTDLKGLRALREEHRVKRMVVVTREDRPRTTEDRIELLPWRSFCTMLWAGEMV